MHPITVLKLNKLTDRVEYCLREYPETRNSDIELFARLCERFYPPFDQPLYNWRDLAGALHQVPSLDHLSRLRRKVIEKYEYKRYLPTDKRVALHRGINQGVFEAYATHNKIQQPKAITPEDIEI